MHTTEQALGAYAAAVQAHAAAGALALGFQEFDDPAVGALVIEVSRDGSIVVTLQDRDGHGIGGYTL